MLVRLSHRFRSRDVRLLQAARSGHRSDTPTCPERYRVSSCLHSARGLKSDTRLHPQTFSTASAVQAARGATLAMPVPAMWRFVSATQVLNGAISATPRRPDMLSDVRCVHEVSAEMAQIWTPASADRLDRPR